MFDQDEYDNAFYYCDKNHPFIAFTTCFCPLCEKELEESHAHKHLIKVESLFEDLSDLYADLMMKVRAVNPELLL
jgi:hypothetical protein